MKSEVKKKVFIPGAILPAFISQSIEKHSIKHDIGAHSIFLGQVRADVINEKQVVAIDYSCYEAMAEEIFHEIREETFSKFQLSCMHIYHSLGRVETGGISLFVFTSSKHRGMATEACSFVVEQIKSRVPVWGKELFADETHIWKINT